MASPTESVSSNSSEFEPPLDNPAYQPTSPEEQLPPGAADSPNTDGAAKVVAEITIDWPLAEKAGDKDDSGGIIVKDALVTASFDDKSVHTVCQTIRLLIFSGCPHKDYNISSLQGKLAMFLMGVYEPWMVEIAPTIALTESLAQAVEEVNGMFVESKMYIRCSLISIYTSNSSPHDMSNVFNEETSTLGLPMERKICWNLKENPGLDNVPVLRKSLDDTQSGYIPPLSDLPLFHDVLISLACPLDPFVTLPDSSHAIHGNKTISEWVESPSGRILCLQGTDRRRDVGEQMFYKIQEELYRWNIDPFVLYFTFAAHHARRRPLSSMLSTFIAQTLSHSRGVWNLSADIMFEQLNEDRGLNDHDLLNHFRRVCNLPYCLSIVIDGVDQCSGESKTLLFDLLSRFVDGSEASHRIAVIAHESKSEFFIPKDWITVEMETMLVNMHLETPCGHMKSCQLLHFSPDILNSKRACNKEWRCISDSHHIACYIFNEQMRVHKEWSRDFLQERVSEISAGVANITLEMLVDQVFRRIPDQEAARVLLSWLIHSERPLTVWEVADVMSLNGFAGWECEGEPTSYGIQRVILTLERWLAGIVEIRHNEIRISSPELWSVFKSPRRQEQEAYFWQEAGHFAQLTITKQCFQYLSLPRIISSMNGLYREPEIQRICAPVLLSRRSLCLKPSSVLCRVNCWESIWTAFFGLGILPSSLSDKLESPTATLFEAARSGRSQSVTDALTRHELSQSDLLRTLMFVLAACSEDTALAVLDQLERKQYRPIDWHPNLLYRAVFLGWSRCADRLLSMGCHPEPGGIIGEVIKITPLHLALNNDDPETVRVLLKHNASLQSRDLMGGGVYTQCLDIAGGISTIKILAEKGCTAVDERDNYQRTAVYVASSFGRPAVLRCLLDLKADPNMGMATVNGLSPLSVAAVDGYSECVRTLLEYQADVNRSDSDGRTTPLRCAATNCHVDTCRILLEHGADPNSSLINPPILISALKLAKTLPFSKILEVLELLLSYGAAIDAQDDTGRTALQVAVTHDNLSLVQFLLDHHADPNKFGEEVGPLWKAIDSGEDMLRLLLEAGANPNVQVPTGSTPLMQATISKKPKAVQLLLDYGALIDTPTPSDSSSPGLTAFVEAILSGDHGLVRQLADAGANLEAKVGEGSYPIHWALSKGTLRPLLEYRKRIDIEKRDSDGDTALIYASRLQDVQMDDLRLLINAGANVNTQNDEGLTPLMSLVHANDTAAFQLLMADPEIDVNLTSRAYGSALHQACFGARRDLDIIEQLVDRGVDVNLTAPGFLATPLHACCHAQYDRQLAELFEILRYLISKGADVNASAGPYGSVIAAAAARSNSQVLRFLIEEQGSINIHDKFGRLPIHWATFHGVDNLRTLVDAGADINTCDWLGRTPLHWAAFAGRAEVVEYILHDTDGHGVNVDDIDLDGWTPLCWAARCNGGSGGDLEWAEEPSPDLVPTIRVLLENGANLSTLVSIDGTMWSPLKISRYSSAPKEIQVLLEVKARGQDARDRTKPGSGRANRQCDACRWYEIRGVAYHCQTCPDFDLCKKCYAHRDLFHVFSPSHTFEEVGTEFDGGAVEIGSDSEMAKEDSDSDSDESS
ncbi:unnamed protein product [Penicillium bialowiezense]